MLVLRVGHMSFSRGNSEAALRQHGIRSEQAESGREALEFLRLYDYDLVLMDLRLKDVAAYEVVRMMRAAGFKVPVVVLSDAYPLFREQISSVKEANDILTGDLTKRREAVSGVSLDEEATNLLKWQTAFTANSKVTFK